MSALDELTAALPCGSLRLTEVPGVAGVRCWLLGDDVPREPLGAEQFRRAWDEPPFWAFAWPAGCWLAAHLPRVEGGRVIDLGCGSGLLSIALARAGVEVHAVDRDPRARLATRLNATENGVSFPVWAELEEVPGPAELLLLADFLYDPANLGELEGLCARAQRTLLADCRLRVCPPGFRSLPEVDSVIVPDLDWNHEFSRVLRAERGSAQPSKGGAELRSASFG